MCNLYTPVDSRTLMAQFATAAIDKVWGSYVAPLKLGPYVRQQGIAVAGQWGLIPKESLTRIPTNKQGKRLSTNNARREGMAKSWTFGPAWREGQRCLIPATAFEEPYYPEGSTRSIAWRFGRADGEAWALAGLWAEWEDPETGEIIPSYTMLTQNCDAHPLLKLMHKPERDPQGQILPIDKQDKRAVVPLARELWDEWLHGTPAQADALIQLPAPELFRHGAVDLSKNIPLQGDAALGQIPPSESELLF